MPSTRSFAHPGHAISSWARAATRRIPREVGLADFPTTTVDALAAEPAADDPAFPDDWEARQAAWGRPTADEVFELVFTSGTTGTPKGVMLTHDNVVASIESFHRIVPPMDHRIVSLLPLSHLLEQAVGLYYALDVGADILYVRSRNPRVIFDALRDHRVTSMVVVPQVLDLFWSAIEREIDEARTSGDASSVCAASPATCRSRSVACCSGASTASSAARSGCSCRQGRSCRRPCRPPGRTSA